MWRWQELGRWHIWAYIWAPASLEQGQVRSKVVGWRTAAGCSRTGKDGVGGLPQIMQLINQRENPAQPLVPAMTPQGQDPVACATLVLCQDHIPTTPSESPTA